MTITVTFNSLEEMNQFCNGIAVAPGLLKNAEPAVAVKETKADKRTKKEPVKETEESASAEPQAEEDPAEEVTYTLEDVRAKLGALQKAGHRDDVKKLLKSVGAEKLPEVDPKDYGVLMQKAGELDA